MQAEQPLATSSSIDYGHSVHSVRNIIGRVTFGLVGLDKLLQNDPSESKRFLGSFLSLLETGEGSETRATNPHRLLPEVEDTISVYDPQITKELLTVAERVRKVSETQPKKEEIELVYDALEALLDRLYERTSVLSRPNSLE